MHYPRKRFGQHFLKDAGVIQKIVAALAPKKSDHLIEIGPGRGALTFPVLQRTQELEAIEIDQDLISELSQHSKPFGRLTIHSGDVLKIDFSQLKTDARPLRLFGNLPYNISTPLLFHLFKAIGVIEEMLFMLQKEVAERMAAKVNDMHYGRLSVMTQYYCKVDLLFDVPPTAFFPPPRVQSSIVRLRPFHINCKADDEWVLQETVKLAFGQRRKTLRNSLKKLTDDLFWKEINLSSDLRAEALSVEDFVRLSNALGLIRSYSSCKQR